LQVLVSLMVATAALTVLSPSAYADRLDREIKFDIPAQPMPSALVQFAKQANVQLITASIDLGKLLSPGVTGKLAARHALEKVLGRTGLTYSLVGENTVTIRLGPTTSDDTQLPAPPDAARSARLAQSDATIGQSQISSDGPQSNNSATSVSSNSEKSGLTEIIVTAQKREERLQDVPVPVTAIRADTLVQTNQLRLQDYYTSVPGLSVAPANQSTQLISIRGITTGGVTNPTVGVTIDDVPFGASTNAGGGLVVPDIDPGDLASVEVLRGPQGSLYGASSMGGLVKFITVDPSTAGLSGRVEAGLSHVENGAQAGYQFRGSVNVPLGDTLAIRASAFTHQDPGYIDNPVLHINGINEEHVSGGRLSALWRPSDSVSLKLSAIYQEAKSDGSNVVEVPSAGYPQTNKLTDLEQNDLRGTGGYDRKVQAYSATLAAKLGIFDVTAISGFNTNQFNDSFDYSYAFGSSAQALLGVSGSPILNFSKTEKFSQELRLNAPIGEHIDWLVGTFYTHEHSIFSENIAAANSATGALVGTLIYVPIPTTYAEYAGFTDLTFHLSDRFDIQLGGRESKIKQTFSETESGAFFPTPSIVPQTDTNASAFTYLFTPRFKISTDLMVYARLASGYRAGGSNPLPGSGTPPEYRPDKTQDYDLGIKGDFLDHRLSLDASLYRIDWKNIQLQLFNPLTGGDYNTNGSRAKSQGLELSVQSRPLTGLTVAAWMTWDNAELTEPFPSGSTAVGTSGDPLPNTSKFSANLTLQQEFPLGTDLRGFVGGAVSYIGERQGLFTASPERQYFPAYARTDLRAGLKYNSWTTNLYANNVADRRGAISGGLGTFPPFGFYLIEPRTIGLSLVKAF
jgi:iron complex outermembrane receptor protein